LKTKEILPIKYVHNHNKMLVALFTEVHFKVKINRFTINTYNISQFFGLVY
jgi:hypothetical protein